MKTKNYTNQFFIKEVQKQYKKTGKRPQMRQFSWSTTAHRRFGSWNALLKRAGIVKSLEKFEIEAMVREKEQIWKEILLITYDFDWHLDPLKSKRIEYLRKTLEEISQELSEQ